jgi:hypothetical protein
MITNIYAPRTYRSTASQRQVPRETQKVYEAKGRLLSLIEEMNKVGKIAFWGQNDIAGLFNVEPPSRNKPRPQGQENDRDHRRIIDLHFHNSIALKRN